ncbi:MAG: iron ABC transporter substrate-binding protein, partial [Porphyromonadaceae bacterium]|nr:iron ABC transporter substrate-binding protein [Porphyromonadaceae bacterium]
KAIVYCNMRDVPFYENMPMEPQEVLADLIHIFHPELLPNHKPVFYHRLK